MPRETAQRIGRPLPAWPRVIAGCLGVWLLGLAVYDASYERWSSVARDVLFAFLGFWGALSGRDWFDSRDRREDTPRRRTRTLLTTADQWALAIFVALVVLTLVAVVFFDPFRR